MLRRVRELGLSVDREPEGTFYVWASLADLPSPLDDSMDFFRAALDQRVITVPGVFFDVNPGQRRVRRLSRFHRHVRFSFGPERREVEEGLARLAALVQKAPPAVSVRQP